MKHAIAAIVAQIVIAFVPIPRAIASDFTIYTQNLLHFGQGTATVKTAKCAAVAKAANKADIIVIQELMQSAYPCPSMISGFKWVSFGPLGTSYKEYYGFLWRSTTVAGKPLIEDLKDYAMGTGTYIRPPHAVAFKISPTGGKTPYFILIGNIHSIFGKGVKPRQQEAILAGGFFSFLRTDKINSTVAPSYGWPVIIAGDWNLPVVYKNNKYTPGFSWLPTADADGEPDKIPTSLAANGKPSSPYDHFIFNKVLKYSGVDHGITIDSIEYNPPLQKDRKTWRNTVSDHLGIFAGITVK